LRRARRSLHPPGGAEGCILARPARRSPANSGQARVRGPMLAGRWLATPSIAALRLVADALASSAPSRTRMRSRERWGRHACGWPKRTDVGAVYPVLQLPSGVVVPVRPDRCRAGCVAAVRGDQQRALPCAGDPFDGERSAAARMRRSAC
jgi:hypothetical protein